MLVSQLAAYLVTTELDRRIDGITATSGATFPYPPEDSQREAYSNARESSIFFRPSRLLKATSS